MVLVFLITFSMPTNIQRGRHILILQVLIVFIQLQYIRRAFCIRDHEVEDHKKIIFFHEILYRVEEPLQYAVWKECGHKLQSNKDFYQEYNEAMEFFQLQYVRGELLKTDEFFGVLVKSHYEQVDGLFHFLYQPHDWSTFVQNACWARQHVNAHMFVYALTLAAVQRELAHVMMLPKIYEILPRYFLNWQFIKSAKEFDNKDFKVSSSSEDHLRRWQWWKEVPPFDQSWRSFNTSYSSTLDNMNLLAWWRPVDYTRDLNIMNEHVQLSYLTEDVDWNAYWYHLNLMYPFFLHGKSLFWRDGSRRGEFWLYSLQQMITRYELERFSLGFDETTSLEWFDDIKDGYDSQLHELNGCAFDIRENNCKLSIKRDNFDILAEFRYKLERIEEAIHKGYFLFRNGTRFDLTGPESLEIVSNLLQCNIDALDGSFDTHWYLLAQLFLSGGAGYRNYLAKPSVFLNFETMLRDPLFYVFHKRIVNNLQHFRAKLLPYTKAELYVPGLQIVSAEVSELMTYFDVFDLDVSNLQSIKDSRSNVTILFARQMRLAHKPFHFNLTIIAQKKMTAMLRVFLLPIRNIKERITINENRKHFLELNKILVHLDAGKNRKIFSYDKYFTSTNSKATDHFSSKRYFDALNIVQHNRLYKPYDSMHYCGLNARLLLPRGSVIGLPMQLFFILSNLEESEESSTNWWKLCLPIQGRVPFGFPFDRPNMKEENFNNTNMYWKSVKIYHKENHFNITRN